MLQNFPYTTITDEIRIKAIYRPVHIYQSMPYIYTHPSQQCKTQMQSDFCTAVRMCYFTHLPVYHSHGLCSPWTAYGGASCSRAIASNIYLEGHIYVHILYIQSARLNFDYGIHRRDVIKCFNMDYIEWIMHIWDYTLQFAARSCSITAQQNHLVQLCLRMRKNLSMLKALLLGCLLLGSYFYYMFSQSSAIVYFMVFIFTEKNCQYIYIYIYVYIQYTVRISLGSCTQWFVPSCSNI